MTEFPVNGLAAPGQQACNGPSNLHMIGGLSAAVVLRPDSIGQLSGRLGGNLEYPRVSRKNFGSPRCRKPLPTSYSSMPLNPFALTTFCDDIRYETAGKFSLIGVYRETLIFPCGTFPITINRLSLSITFVEDSSVLIGDIDVHVLLPGDMREKPSFAFKIEPHEAQQVPDDPEGTRRSLNFHVMLGPLTIRESGLIKVRLINRGRRYRAGALFVGQPTHRRLRPSQRSSAEIAHHSTEPCTSKNGKTLTIDATGECQSDDSR